MLTFFLFFLLIGFRSGYSIESQRAATMTINLREVSRGYFVCTISFGGEVDPCAPYHSPPPVLERTRALLFLHHFLFPQRCFPNSLSLSLCLSLPLLSGACLSPSPPPPASPGPPGVGKSRLSLRGGRRRPRPRPEAPQQPLLQGGAPQAARHERAGLAARHQRAFPPRIGEGALWCFLLIVKKRVSIACARERVNKTKGTCCWAAYSTYVTSIPEVF